MFRTLRSTLVSGAAFFRTPSNATTAIAGMMEIEAKHRAETESWVNPEALASGKGGAFDACDLRHWLALANRAGVRAVPAKQILVLTEDQMDAASGTIRSEEHTSELQSIMRISYAVFFLKQKKNN